MQKDFITGPLQSEQAKKIVPKINTLLHIAENLHYQIIYTMCTYDKTETQTPYCIYQTDGWEITNKSHLADELEKIKAVCIQKQNLAALQLPYALHPKTEEVFLCGLHTDTAVISNAILLKTYFHTMPLTIYQDACAGTTPETHQAAIQIARNCGITIKTYETSEFLL